MVPHFATALSGPINELEQRILDSMSAIERWFRLEWMEHTPAFYCAADVRNAGFKLASVETQLFPDGWDHLTAEMLPLAVQAAMAAIEKICPEARNLLIVPENGRHSASYLASLVQLRRVFHMAGLNVRMGSISAEVKKPTTIALPTGESITLEPVLRNKGRIGVKDFDPCTILLNNDLRAGVPGILEELHQQYLLPPLHAGWSIRRKSVHARCYEEVCKRFGKLIGVDPWLMNPLFDACGQLDLADPNHKEYGIKEKPFVLIKADDHRLQWIPVVVHGAQDLDALEFAPVHGHQSLELLLQEGVPSSERVNREPVAPMVYMMDRYVVGGYYRAHGPRAADAPSDGLQDAGVAPLAFAEGVHLPQPGARPGASAPNRFYMYGVVGRLAMLAASYELEATDPQAHDYS
jgi:glutamate--cysteine ligase